MDQPKTIDLASTNPPVLRQVPSTSGKETASQVPDSDMDTDTDKELANQTRVACHVEEGKVSDQDQDTTTPNLDLALSEEQTYQETMKGFSHSWAGKTSLI